MGSSDFTLMRRIVELDFFFIKYPITVQGVNNAVIKEKWEIVGNNGERRRVADTDPQFGRFGIRNHTATWAPPPWNLVLQ